MKLTLVKIDKLPLPLALYVLVFCVQKYYYHKMSTIDPKTARAMVRLDHELTEEEEEAAAEDPFEMSD